MLPTWSWLTLERSPSRESRVPHRSILGIGNTLPTAENCEFICFVKLEVYTKLEHSSSGKPIIIILLNVHSSKWLRVTYCYIHRSVHHLFLNRKASSCTKTHNLTMWWKWETLECLAWMRCLYQIPPLTSQGSCETG